MRSTQRFVSGEIRVRLDRGALSVVGRRSPHSLYSTALATYGKGDLFDHKASEGFITVFGMSLRTQARTQALWGAGTAAALDVPRKELSASDEAVPGEERARRAESRRRGAGRESGRAEREKQACLSYRSSGGACRR